MLIGISYFSVRKNVWKLKIVLTRCGVQKTPKRNLKHIFAAHFFIYIGRAWAYYFIVLQSYDAIFFNLN